MTGFETGFLPGFTPWPDEFARRYRQEGYWQGTTLWEMLAKSASAFPERIAVTDGNRCATYAELLSRSSSLAAGLRELGLQHQDRVVAQMPNVVEFVEVAFALSRFGAIPVFALPAHRAGEVTYFCRHAQAAAYVVAGEHGGFDYRALARQVQAEAPSLRHVIVAGEAQEHQALGALYGDATKIEGIPLPASSDVALMQLSGGSTGTPKLIPRTHDDYLYSVRTSNDVCAMTADSVYLVALPAAHNFPMSSPGFLGALMAGATVVLAAQPSPEVVFDLIESQKVTMVAAVPPLAQVWLDAAAYTQRDLSSLRVLQVGGARLKDEVASRIQPAFDCQLQQVFGMAEGLVNYTRLDDDDEQVTKTQGRPLSPADEVRVVDEHDQDVADGEPGLLLTRGPYTIRGYFDAPDYNPSAFTPDGFYRTGDLVIRRADGYLNVVGRDKDQINRGGEKIAVEEIENILLSHPGVRDALVVAMPDAYLGERSCAIILPASSPPTTADLKVHIRARGLAAYKVPDRFEFRKEFPQTGVGKINRRQARAELHNQLAQMHPISEGRGNGTTH